MVTSTEDEIGVPETLYRSVANQTHLAILYRESLVPSVNTTSGVSRRGRPTLP